jgi:hypothetical protein
LTVLIQRQLTKLCSQGKQDRPVVEVRPPASSRIPTLSGRCAALGRNRRSPRESARGPSQKRQTRQCEPTYNAADQPLRGKQRAKWWLECPP